MKLRNKLLIAFFVLVTLAGVGMTAAANYFFIQERESNLYDLAAALLPKISENLNADLVSIQEKVFSAFQQGKLQISVLESVGLKRVAVIKDGEQVSDLSIDEVTKQVVFPSVKREEQLALYPAELDGTFWVYSRPPGAKIELLILVRAETLAALHDRHRHMLVNVYSLNGQGPASIVHHWNGDGLMDSEIEFQESPIGQRVVVIKKVNDKWLQANVRLESFANGYVVGMMPISKIIEATIISLKNSAGIIFMVFIAALALAFYFARGLAKPLEELQGATAKIAKGEWVELRAKSRDEIGRLIRAFNKMSSELSLRDVQLRKTMDQLARTEKLAALGKLSAGIAHEVKNPLNSILGLAQLWLRKNTQGPEKDSEAMSLIVSETKRANKILADLLMFSRDEKPRLAQEDLVMILNKFMATQGPVAVNSGVKFELHTELKELVVSVDKDQLLQVLSNLVGNAIHAVEGRPKREVTVLLNVEDGFAVIRVKDTGMGIEQKDLEQIFEPFFTTKKIGVGTGLGLSICYGIVESHQGTIKVNSCAGEGSEFEVKLPIFRP